ncbi:MAG: AAA family ATPase [Gemmataceae bacterium]
MNVEQLVSGIIGMILAVITAIVVEVVRRWVRPPSHSLENIVADQNEDLERAQEQLLEVVMQNFDFRIENYELQLELKEHKEECARLGGKLEISERKLQKTNQELEEATEAWQETQAGHEALNKQRRSLDRRVRRALALEGKIWTQTVMARTPKFRELRDRKVPIISVLNLKGGVGKTTTTAYLATALNQVGMRVLLVDMDLQGSLTSLLTTIQGIERRDQEGALLRHFFENATRNSKSSILSHATPVFDGKSQLIATTDRLAYAEMNLTFSWLLRTGTTNTQWDGRHDVRFILRKALHKKGIARKFDAILIDCPPLINLCCVNALAASDYVIVPVTPSRKAVERVPNLLTKVREIKDSIHPHLDILGMVATRTHRMNAFTVHEDDLWGFLRSTSHNAWGTEVPMFDTFIPDRVSVRDAEETFEQNQPACEVMPVFEQLVGEVARAIPNYCRVSGATWDQQPPITDWQGASS